MNTKFYPFFQFWLILWTKTWTNKNPESIDPGYENLVMLEVTSVLRSSSSWARTKDPLINSQML
jgi:hypothetical protein